MPTENKITAPEEYAGVDFGIDGRSVRVSQEAYSIFLAREAAGREKIAGLQQRLTAADERVDLLEGLLANAYESAAKWVDKRRDAYVDEHGSSDPETGTVEFPGDGEEYVGELIEIAEGLRALKPA